MKKMDKQNNNKLKLFFIVMILSIAFGACTGGSEEEKKFGKVFSNINKDWQLYEITTEGENIFFRVEVPEIVSFKDAKKAMEELHKIDPKLKGFVEFFNASMGIVLRKVELVPAT